MRLRRTVFLATALLTGAAAVAAPPPGAGEPPADPASLIAEAVRLVERNDAAAALGKAEDAYFAVWDRLALGFRRVEIVDGRPTGYDQIEPRGNSEFAPGETITVYVAPFGFGWRKDGEAWATDLGADFVLATPEGRILAGQKGFADFRIRSARRDPETFLTVDYTVSGVPAGDYVLTTTMHDRIDDETASFDLAITID